MVEVREGTKKATRESRPPPLSSLLDSSSSSSSAGRAEETAEQRKARLTARVRLTLQSLAITSNHNIEYIQFCCTVDI